MKKKPLISGSMAYFVSIFANLGISIAFVGVLMPKLTFLMRQKLHGSKDNPAIVQVENQFKANKKSGII